MSCQGQFLSFSTLGKFVTQKTSPIFKYAISFRKRLPFGIGEFLPGTKSPGEFHREGNLPGNLYRKDFARRPLPVVERSWRCGTVGSMGGKGTFGGKSSLPFLNKCVFSLFFFIFALFLAPCGEGNWRRAIVGCMG